MEPKKTLPCNYAICCSKTTAASWNKVIAVLTAKYAEKFAPASFIYGESVTELRPILAHVLPYYTCFIAPPAECTREFVKDVLDLTRSLTPGPYTDTIWGILTAPDEETACHIAAYNVPLLVRKTVSNCPIPLDKCCEGVTYSELSQGKSWVKSGASCAVEQKECDCEVALNFVSEINHFPFDVDLMVTSAHANEKNWRPAYCFPGGTVTHKEDCNELEATSVSGDKTVPIDSRNPKVYVAAGNCLMAHVLQDKPCMALSWMKSANVMQFVGYTVPTWFGYGGWGTLKYFMETAGEYSLSEAYFANMQCMLYDAENPTKSSEFIKGCKHDAEVVTFYGDPAWSVRLLRPEEAKDKVAPPAYKMTAKSRDNMWTVSVETLATGKWDCEIADDKSTRPGRPPLYIFPRRLKNPKTISGNAIVTGLFVMFKLAGEFQKGERHEVAIAEN